MVPGTGPHRPKSSTAPAEGLKSAKSKYTRRQPKGLAKAECHTTYDDSDTWVIENARDAYEHISSQMSPAQAVHSVGNWEFRPFILKVATASAELKLQRIGLQKMRRPRRS